MKWTLLLVIILLSCSGVHAWETKELNYNNETLRITPILTGCENTTTVFRIERMNHTTTNNNLIVNYQVKLNNVSENISKTINQYTQSKTGSYYTTTTNQQLIFVLDQELEWTIYCEENTLQEQQNITEEKTLEPECPQQVTINTPTNTLRPGDQVLMQHLLNYWPEEYEITYWITNQDDEEIKTKRTTNNNQTKTYTIPKSNTDKWIALHAQVETASCAKKETTQYITIEQEKETFTQLLQLSTEIKKEQLILILKSEGWDDEIATLQLTDYHNNALSEKATVSLGKKQQTQRVPFPLPENKEIKAIAKTTTQSKETPVFLESKPQPLIQKTYTRQTSVSNTLTWYVRVETTKAHAIQVQYGTQSQTQYFPEQQTHTATFIFNYEDGINSINTSLFEEKNQVNKEDTLLLLLPEQKESDDKPANRTQIAPITASVIAESVQAKNNPPYWVFVMLISIAIVFALRKKLAQIYK